MAGQLADRLDLGPFRGQLVKSLSDGQRRRVALAVGLVALPRLLVLDEPTTGLDPRSRQAVSAAVRGLVADGITLLLTTQYLAKRPRLPQVRMR